MNTYVRNAAAALLVLAAGAGLTACGSEKIDVAPAASVREELNPREHQAYKDLAETREPDGVPVKPFEHRGLRP